MSNSFINIHSLSNIFTMLSLPLISFLSRLACSYARPAVCLNSTPYCTLLLSSGIASFCQFTWAFFHRGLIKSSHFCEISKLWWPLPTPFHLIPLVLPCAAAYKPFRTGTCDLLSTDLSEVRHPWACRAEATVGRVCLSEKNAYTN